MINLNDLLQALKAEVNAPQGGHIRPQANFERWCNTISNDLYLDYLDQFEKSQRISDNMTPFMVTANIALTVGTGHPHDTFTRPADYDRFASARVLIKGMVQKGCGCQGHPVVEADGSVREYTDADDRALAAIRLGEEDREIIIKKVDHSEWTSATGHLIKKPTFQKPLLTQEGNGFKVVPRGIGIILLTYFRAPIPCVFAYTIGVDDQIIYNSSTSVNLEWPSTMMPEFVTRLKEKYGGYIREEFLVQTANAEQRER